MVLASEATKGQNEPGIGVGSRFVAQVRQVLGRWKRPSPGARAETASGPRRRFLGGTLHFGQRCDGRLLDEASQGDQVVQDVRQEDGRLNPKRAEDR